MWVLRTAPWRLALRHPGVLLAVAGTRSRPHDPRRAACAVGFAAAVRGLLDVNPLYPPGGLLRPPVGLLLLGGAVLLAAAHAAALGTQRVADAADPATLLRGADS